MLDTLQLRCLSKAEGRNLQGLRWIAGAKLVLRLRVDGLGVGKEVGNAFDAIEIPDFAEDELLDGRGQFQDDVNVLDAK